MAAKPKTPAEAAAHFQAFLCAGILDLCRLVKLPELKDLCPGARPSSKPPASSDLPPVPAVAQLASYLRLVSRGLQPKHELYFAHRERFRDLLQRVSSKASRTWDEGELKAVDGLQASVRTLARFARKRIPLFEYTTDGLESFGVTSVRKAMRILTEKVAMVHARQIAKRLAKDPNSVAPEVLGASLVASATSPGIVASLGRGHTVRGLMKLGVNAGLQGSTSGGKPRKKSAGQEELRRLLKRVGKVLDDRQ